MTIIPLKILLFLVGTTITTGHVLINRMPSRSWKPAANHILMSHKLSHLPSPPIEPMDLSYGISSSSSFWPLTSNLFYKPRIIMAPNETPLSTEIHQNNCDEYKESITFSADDIVRTKPLQTIEIKPTPEKNQEIPIPIPVMEIIEPREPLIIPQAPELPALTEIPTSSLIEDEVPINPLITEFKPIDIPKTPHLPSFGSPEKTFFEAVPCPEESKPLPESSPITIPTLPQIPNLKVPEMMIPIEIEVEPINKFVPSALLGPKDAESKPLNIPTAPKLPPVVLPELPASVYVENISSYPKEASKQPEEIEIISEFRPFNTPTAPDFAPLHLPEPPFISSYSPVKSPECEESIINQQFKPTEIVAAPELPPLFLAESKLPTPIETVSNITEYLPALELQPLQVIPAAPELPPLSRPDPLPVEYTSNFLAASALESQPLKVNILSAPELPLLTLPELASPIEIIPNQVEDAPNKYSSGENIPAAPRLPPLSITEQSGPIKILEQISTPEIKPLIISTIPPVPTLAVEPISIESDVPKSSEEDMIPLVIPPSPELPPVKIFKLPPITPAAPLIVKKPEEFIDNLLLPTPPELPYSEVHKIEPIIVKLPAGSNSQEACKKHEELQSAFISQALQRPMMYPMFLAQNIIIDRVVPNLYLSHMPYTDKSAPDRHPVIFNDNVDSEIY